MNEPGGSQKSQTCNTCGQPLPDQPVYVGPGDKVRLLEFPGEHELSTADYEVIASPESAERHIIIGGWFGDNYYNAWHPSRLRTLDGRPIAGFKDPRDERIKELEAQVSEYVAWCDDLQDQLSSSTNPLAGLSDEQLYGLATKTGGRCHYVGEAEVTQRILDLLRDIRDGKLEVPR